MTRRFEKSERIDAQMVLADNIRELVDSSGYGDITVAKILRITSSQLHRYKYGLDDVPAVIANDICKFFNVDVRKIFVTDKEWSLLKGVNKNEKNN